MLRIARTKSLHLKTFEGKGFTWNNCDQANFQIYMSEGLPFVGLKQR